VTVQSLLSSGEELQRVGEGSCSRTIWLVRAELTIFRTSEDKQVSACFAALSQNGQYVLTGSCFGTTHLFEATTGKELKQFVGRSAVRSVALSPDAKLLLTAGGAQPGTDEYKDQDYTVHLWDVQSGNELRTFKGHSATVYAVAFLAENTIASASGDNTIRIWDTATGSEVRRYSTTPRLSSTVFSTDARRVLIGLNTGTAELRSTETGEVLREFSGHNSVVSATALSADGTRAVTGSWDTSAQLWNTTNGAVLQRFSGSRTRVMSAQWLADGQSLVTIITETPLRDITTAHLWRLASGSVTDDFQLRDNLNNANISQIDFSRDGKFILIGDSHDNSAELVETATGNVARRFVGQASPVLSVAFSGDGKLVATGSGTGMGITPCLANNSDNSIRLWNANTGEQLYRFVGYPCGVGTVAFSPDDQSLFTSSWYDMTNASVVREWNVGTKTELWHGKAECNWDGPATFSPNGAWLVGPDCFPNLTFKLFPNGSRPWLWSATDGKDWAMPWNHPGGTGGSLPVFTAQSQLLTDDWRHTGVMLWDIAQRRLVREFVSDKSAVVSCVAPSKDGELVAAGFSDGSVIIWNTASPQPVRRFETNTALTYVGFSVDARFVLAGSANGEVQVWDAATGGSANETPLLTMISSRDASWAVVAPDGRFDSSELEQLPNLHWVFPDAPLHALSANIFMRDYYEPRLLARLLSCTQAEQIDLDACKNQFKPVRPLAELNRIQPEVKICALRRGASADEASVEVEALGKKDPTQPNHKIQTAAYDLRLFRSGQLVGEWPAPEHAVAGPEDLTAWRRVSAVPTARHTFHVHLAARDRGQPVTFTAYAFNEDRVKSETTAPSKYTVPQDVPARQAKAYVITIGVNGYENPRRNLEFAVKDAEDMAFALRQIKDYDVVSVSLLSEAPKKGEAPLDQATKAKIRAVLDVLAGKSDGVRLNGVANADKLAKATPDDLVILSFSGHGYTEHSGAFYLLPSDSGKEDAITPAELKKFISSEELSEWLRDVDVGQLAMIIDACHSAASVDAGGFKPGPMGDRGLGQLAYDKGMMILAASQADDVALEIHDLHQGLLTYALLEGLSRGEGSKLKADLNGHGVVTLEEWLKYGEQRVASLYEDAKAGRVHMISRDPTPNPHFIDETIKHAQTPALFDFYKHNNAVMLATAMTHSQEN
jgi:WD40 repeat protein/uncharacterized caspase-like protein